MKMPEQTGSRGVGGRHRTPPRLRPRHEQPCPLDPQQWDALTTPMGAASIREPATPPVGEPSQPAPPAGRILLQHHPSAAICTCIAAGMTAILVSLLSQRFVALPAQTYSPAPPGVRIVTALLWVFTQTICLAAAHRTTPIVFALTTAVGSILGLAIMTIGRYSTLAAGWLACFSCALVLIPIGVGVAASLVGRTTRHPTGRALRLLWALSHIGIVVLYSAAPPDGLAHARAVAAALVICGIFFLAAPIIENTITFLEASSFNRLALFLWGTAGLLILANAIVVHARHLPTPQITIGPVSFAPYLLAGLAALTAVSLELTHPRAPVFPLRLLVGLGATGMLFAVALKESGTFALVCISTLALAIVLARPATLSLILTAAWLAYRSIRQPWFAKTVGVLSSRAGNRLVDWQTPSAAPAQLRRLVEVTHLSGLIGHAGAARPIAIVGIQAPADYAWILILAQAGWAGMLLCGAGLVAFVVALASCAAHQTGLRRAVTTAISSAFAGNLLLSLLPINASLPIIGLPMPCLARAGSHILVAASAVALVDILAGSTARTGEEEASNA